TRWGISSSNPGNWIWFANSTRTWLVRTTLCRSCRDAGAEYVLVFAISILLLGSAADAAAQLTLRVADYATMPMTGVADGVGNDGLLARINFMREEPGGARRFFVNDLNGPLYILDKETKQSSVYLDFHGSGTKTGLFDKLPIALGLAGGFISFQFDPDYAKNGRFYTIHLEDPKMPGSSVPDNSHFPGLKIDGYTPTPAIETPGEIDREAVLIEW